MNTPELQQKTFLILLVAVTLAFGWILWPYYGAVFWGVVLAILFNPFYRQLLGSMRNRRNLAALATLVLCLLVVIFPLTMIAASLIQEAGALYEKLRSGQLDFRAYFTHIGEIFPPWLTGILDRFGLGNLSALQDRLSSAVVQGSQFLATHAVSIGHNAFYFLISFGVMLYLLYFLLRDGTVLSARIRHAIPMSAEHKQQLFSKFTAV
ncbi:MAG: family transporter, partial [Noviherbaspirillum sp.]|nr:family transporter [Noviherbaspirillum sp.]